MEVEERFRGIRFSIVLVGCVRITQRPVSPAQVGQVEAVVTVEADVAADEWRQPGSVLVTDRVALCAQLPEHGRGTPNSTAR